MAEQSQEERWRRADEEVRKKLPPGVMLVRTLRGHAGNIAACCLVAGRANAGLGVGRRDDPVVGCGGGRVPAHAERTSREGGVSRCL